MLDVDPDKEVSERALCAISWLFCHSRSVTGLDGFFAGVTKLRELDGLPPLPRNDYFKAHKRGLKNIFGPMDVRSPAPPLTA